MMVEMMYAAITPRTPPVKVMASASDRNCTRMCRAGAQRLLHADLARTLRDRHEHDVHQADAADAEREKPDEGQQDLDAGRDDAELR